MILASAAFLAAHGLIHVAFLQRPPAPTPGGPAWPFSLQDTWLGDRLGLGSAGRRAIGTGLVLVTLVAWGLAAFAALGVGPAALWPASVALGAVASATVLVAWFHRWLVLGIAIDIGLLWAVLIAGWVPA